MKDFARIFLLTLFWALVVWGTAATICVIFPPVPGVQWTGAGLFSGWKAAATSLARWDSKHYIRIADSGYFGDNKPFELIVFYPLLPLLMRASANLFLHVSTSRVLHYVFAAMCINFISVTAALFLIKKIFEKDFPRQSGFLVLVLMLVWPWAFFYASVYPEALYLFVMVAAFAAARYKHWWLAAIFAALSAVTRAQGIFLIPALLVEYLHQCDWKISKIRPNILWLSLCPVGFVFFMQHVHGWANYSKASFAWGERRIHLNPLYPFWSHLARYRDPNFMIPTPDPDSYGYLTMVDGMNLAVFCLAAFLFLYGLRKIRPSYSLFTFICMVVPYISTAALSLGRYYMVLFPLFFSGVLFLEKRPAVLYVSLAFFGMLSAFLITCFTLGHWVA